MLFSRGETCSGYIVVNQPTVSVASILLSQDSLPWPSLKMAGGVRENAFAKDEKAAASKMSKASVFIDTWQFRSNPSVVLASRENSISAVLPLRFCSPCMPQ